MGSTRPTFPVLTIVALVVGAFFVPCLADDDLTVEERQARLDMELIAVVIENAQERNGRHPASGQAIVRLDSVADLRAAPFDGRFEAEDPWGNPYLYLADDHHFAVLSSGPNGRLDLDYDGLPMQEWKQESGDDIVIAGEGWVRRPLSQRERQKRTMAVLRSVATAIEEFSIDNDLYPTAKSLAELEPLVSPVYIRSVPRVDGWGNPILLESSASYYILRSMGRDGVQDPETPGGGTGSYDSDIVFEMGSFMQWPEGAQY